MNWTEAQLAERLARDHSIAAPSPKPAHRPRTGYRSQTEARYAAHLELMQSVKHIRTWRYEPVALKLAPGVVYWPDFMVCRVFNNAITFQEIKGRRGNGFWSLPVSKVKIRLAAELFPWWRFEIVWPGARPGEWETMLVGKGE